MAPTEGRVARTERRWGCRRGTPFSTFSTGYHVPSQLIGPPTFLPWLHRVLVECWRRAKSISQNCTSKSATFNRWLNVYTAEWISHLTNYTHRVRNTSVNNNCVTFNNGRYAQYNITVTVLAYWSDIVTKHHYLFDAHCCHMGRPTAKAPYSTSCARPG